jgi:hypothetical protein
MIPEALQETPQARELGLLLAQRVQQLDAAVQAIVSDFGLESAQRLVVAAIGYRDVLAQFEAWGREVRTVADEARGATAH